jgi:hypothetical protein
MAVSARCSCILAGLILVVGNAGAADETSWRVEVGKIGKPATALVEVKTRGEYGSAFCIHPSGLFVTNAHVVQSTIPAAPGTPTPPVEITLVLNSGTKTEKTYSAKVVRVDKELDLALLRIDGAKDLPALTLGSDEKLTELEDVVACGFPFGIALAPGKKEYPAVSINAGSITSLRRKDDRLQRIQLDAAVNPGNSGGPLLDKSGKVVGVIVAGVRGSGVNFAIPVSTVVGFITPPEIRFEPPALDRANLYKPVAFEAQLLPLLPSSAPLTAELTLKPGRGGKERTFRLEAADGKHRVTAVPLPPPSGPQPVRLIARFDDGALNATVLDRAFKVGDRELKLSEVRSVEHRPAHRVLLADGKEVEGAVSGLDAVPVRLGGQTMTLDLGKAYEVRFAPAAEANLVWCTLVVRQGDKEVLRRCESLLIGGLLPTPTAGAASVSIKPPALDAERVEHKLEAAVSDVAVGGGGRYLVLHLPSLHKLAVFDVNAAKVVGNIPLPEVDGQFTAGLEDVVVVLPRAGTIERWSLKTLERDVSATLPVKGVIKRIAMGSASHGPLLIYSAVGTEQLDRTSFALINPENMRPIIADLNAQPMSIMAGHYRCNVHIRASADGKIFGLWCTSHSPSGLGIIAYTDTITRTFYSHNSVGHIVPSPDGRAIYTRTGRYALGALGQPPERLENGNPMVPACVGDHYLNLPTPGRAGPPTVELPGKGQSIATLPDLGFALGKEDTITTDLTFDKRVHMFPGAGLIVTIPPTDDRLVLMRVGGEKAP